MAGTLTTSISRTVFSDLGYTPGIRRSPLPAKPFPLDVAQKIAGQAPARGERKELGSGPKGDGYNDGYRPESRDERHQGQKPQGCRRTQDGLHQQAGLRRAQPGLRQGSRYHGAGGGCSGRQRRHRWAFSRLHEQRRFHRDGAARETASNPVSAASNLAAGRRLRRRLSYASIAAELVGRCCVRRAGGRPSAAGAASVASDQTAPSTQGPPELDQPDSEPEAAAPSNEGEAPAAEAAASDSDATGADAGQTTSAGEDPPDSGVSPTENDPENPAATLPDDSAPDANSAQADSAAATNGEPSPSDDGTTTDGGTAPTDGSATLNSAAAQSDSGTTEQQHDASSDDDEQRHDAEQQHDAEQRTTTQQHDAKQRHDDEQLRFRQQRVWFEFLWRPAGSPPSPVKQHDPAVVQSTDPTSRM